MLRSFVVVLLVMIVALPLQAAERVELAHGDLTLVGDLAMADGGTVADGVVLIVHGTLAHGRMEITRAMQELLVEQGYNALTINLGLGQDRREGMYDCESLHDHRHEDAMDEIGAWVDWLKAGGAPRVALVAHSRGGNQAAWYLAEQADPVVERAVLLAPATWEAGRAEAGYEASFGVALGPLLEKAQAEVAAGRAETVLEMDFIYCPEARATARSVVSYYAPEPRKDTPTVLEGVTVPTLVVVAELDEAVTDLEEKMQGRVDDERVSMTVIDGADHMFMDLFVYEAADVTAAFIDWH